MVHGLCDSRDPTVSDKQFSFRIVQDQFLGNHAIDQNILLANVLHVWVSLRLFSERHDESNFLLVTQFDRFLDKAHELATWRKAFSK